MEENYFRTIEKKNEKKYYYLVSFIWNLGGGLSQNKEPPIAFLLISLSGLNYFKRYMILLNL